MKVVIQRVSKASVSIENKIKGEINTGFLILLGIAEDDDINDVTWLTQKIVNLRIFQDDEGLMNKNINEIDGEILLISQFTLHAKTKKGNRPSFIQAAKPEIAIPLYENFINELEKLSSRPIQKGVFGANMQVSLINDGPVTIIIDSKNKE